MHWALLLQNEHGDGNAEHHGEAPHQGNGNMIALAAGSREQVDELYAKALELGGTCEGAPGQRIDNFYAGYFRDLDGNKLNAFCFNEVTV